MFHGIGEKSCPLDDKVEEDRTVLSALSFHRELAKEAWPVIDFVLAFADGERGYFS